MVRASAGSIFTLDVVVADSLCDALERLRTAGYAVVATVARGGDAYDGVDLTGPVAVIVGNEAHGLPDEVVADLDLAVTIPMPGPTESLNVAMAGTIICFEVLRQRRSTVGVQGRLATGQGSSHGHPGPFHGPDGGEAGQQALAGSHDPQT